jgi:colicin import membrane protein
MSRDAFRPRSSGGTGPGFAASVLVHLGLVAALALGVRWHASPPEGVEAELWAAVPQVAAPRAVEPPPVAPAKPEVVAPPPVVKPAPLPDAQIAIERARREEKEKEKEKARKEKQQAEHEVDVRAAQKKALEDEKKRKATEEARLAALHEAQVKRILAQAGATGAATSTGQAMQSAGPSASYAGRIRARIKPNIVYSDAGSGNPLATVEVKLAPEGTIVGNRLVKSSGVPAWDEAVLRAVEKTEVLPRDIDGRVPSSMIIEFKPRD